MRSRRLGLLLVAAVLLPWQELKDFVGLQHRARQSGIPRNAGLTLRYFDARGAAETVRLLFAAAGKEYKDLRYPISFGTPGDFSTIIRKEFEEDRDAGKMDISMGKVPVLDVDGFSLPQSKAIERYLARELGMMGSTPMEEALVDAMAEHVRDINDAYSRKGLFFMKDQEKKAELQKKWYEEELPLLLSKLETALPGSDGFAVGEKVSLADIAIFKLLKDTYDADVSAAYGECPKLKAIVSKVEKNKGIQTWLSERPETMI
ncbi:unnamed protein product [Effrenium voratum]|uniref:Glutathione S-transferase n=1 Tax=Effrenium voratum TaxID=2562239 RepID=A0AA36MWI0_9DINO|nr:unnamed protein product [Effrenium voratum]